MDGGKRMASNWEVILTPFRTEHEVLIVRKLIRHNLPDIVSTNIITISVFVSLSIVWSPIFLSITGPLLAFIMTLTLPILINVFLAFTLEWISRQLFITTGRVLWVE